MAKVIAHTNIAFVKYWGKHPRWEEYLVPTKSSLSFTVRDLHTETELKAEPGKGGVKRFVLNGKEVQPESKDYKKISEYIDRLTRYVSDEIGQYDYWIESKNNFPTAAGLASSASGFAALTKALFSELSREHSWADEILKDPKKLSAVARLGSGSASRSISTGVTLWRRGWDQDDFDPVWDSYAEKVLPAPEDLAIVYVFVKRTRKKISSRNAMRISIRTSPFYWNWVEIEENGIGADIRAIEKRDWQTFFKRVMQHSNSFHAICRSSYPPIEYLADDSIKIMERISEFNREYGTVAAYTFDAGPNPVIFATKDVLNDLKSEALHGYEYMITEPI